MGASCPSCPPPHGKFRTLILMQFLALHVPKIPPGFSGSLGQNLVVGGGKTKFFRYAKNFVGGDFVLGRGDWVLVGGHQILVGGTQISVKNSIFWQNMAFFT